MGYHLRRKIITCIFCITLNAGFALAQSQKADLLWQRIVDLKDSAGLEDNKRLQLLKNEEQKIKTDPGASDSAMAMLYSCIAATNRGLGDFINATKYYRQSIPLFTALGSRSQTNSRQLVIDYYRLSVVYDSLNRMSEMLTNLDSCYTIARRFRMVDVYCLAALYKRLQYFYDAGDYKRCIEYAEICDMLGKEYAGEPGSPNYTIGMNYVSSSFGWKINCMILMKSYNALEAVLTGKIAEYKKKFAYNLGVIYAQLAEIKLYKKEYDSAIFYNNLAFAAEYRQKHYTNCKTLLNNIGYAYVKKANYKQAIDCYKRALGIAAKNDSPDLLDAIETLNVYDGLSKVYVEKHSFDTAFRYLDLAFDQLKKGLTEKELLSISLDEFARQKKVGYLMNLILNKGDAFFKKYRVTGDAEAIKQAIQVFRTADQFLDRIRLEHTEIESKLFWRNDSRRLYEHAIDACYASGNIEDAVYFFEKSRAVLLNDQLKDQRWLDEETILKQTQLRKRIQQLDAELSGTPVNSPRNKDLQNEIFDSNQLMDKLVRIIRAKNPLYYQNYLDSNRISLQEIRQKILSDHNLIEIFSGDSAVYVLTASFRKTKLKKINKPLFDSLSTKYISGLSDPVFLNKHYKEFNQVSHQLYSLVVDNSVLSKSRVIISPDGQYFPFESLVTQLNNNTPVYFVQDYAVSYTYSARFLLNNFSSAADVPTYDFLGVAPVNYPYNMQMASLHGSDKSLQRIQNNFYGSISLVLSNATRKNFLRDFPVCKIIQLYTHASENATNGDPLIYFADSSLSLSSLYNTTLPQTRLVVLSACETGVGKLYRGEGVFSFNRGFAAMGVPSSIANLWSIDNESTYRLTELFYEYLSQKQPADIAMQNAKIEFLSKASQEKRLPYFWSASILIGKTNSIDFKNENLWKMSAVVGGFLLLTCCLFTFLILNAYYKNISYKKKSFSAT